MDKTPKRLVHSTQICFDGEFSASIANIKNLETNESELMITRNPMRPIWITKPGGRNHVDKRIAVRERETDLIVCAEHELPLKIMQGLGQRPQRADKIWRRQILNSPYIYGGDIDYETILKLQLQNATPTDIPVQCSVGALDIENSVMGGKEIILTTFTNQHGECYTAIYAPFLGDKTLDEVNSVCLEVLDKFKGELNPKARAAFDKHDWKINLRVFQREMEGVKCIFDQIHNDKPDFISIWNMAYDIGYFLDRCEHFGINAANLMCHPDVPQDLCRASLKIDKHNVAHFTELWHWFTLSGYSQFIDSQALYSQLRKVKGRENSYALDYIAGKCLGTGKLDLGENNTHYIMQSTADNFVKYIAYNIIDTVILKVMDDLHRDVAQMYSLIGINPLTYWAHQTLRLKGMFYAYCRKNGLVPGSAGSKMKRPEDDGIVNIGGGVLDPLLAIDTGAKIIAELDIATRLHKFTADIDAAAMYPSLSAMANVSKDTKLATILNIDGVPQEFYNDLFGNAIAAQENAVYVASQYFNLPNYNNMLELYDAKRVA